MWERKISELDISKMKLNIDGHFLFWEAVVVLKDPIETVFTLGGCDGLERADFLIVSTLGGCGGLERIDFNSF